MNLRPVAIACLSLIACGPRSVGSSGGEASETGSGETGSGGTEAAETETETDTETETTGGDPCAGADEVIEDDVRIESAAQLAALELVVEIHGDLRITDDTMVELAGANCLQRITGTLFISGNDALERIDDAFARLRLITNEASPWDTGMFITDNPALVSLTGLAALEVIDDRVFVTNNDALVDVRFDALTTIGENFNVGGAALPSLAGLSALTSVGGRLTVSGNSLVDLDGLQNLSSVGARSPVGGLTIGGGEALVSLAGVTLTSVPNLVIRDCEALASLAGLESITTVDRLLVIRDNPVLGSLAGLDSLARVGGSDELDGLSIVGNPMLTSLAGLEGLAEIEQHLHLCDNAGLTDLSALSSLTVLGRITAIYNDALADADATDLAQAIAGVEWIKVDANGPLPPLWWDKPACPWNGDLICDEQGEFQGDVGVECVVDCCDMWGPTHLCPIDTDDDCQDEPLGPP